MVWMDDYSPSTYSLNISSERSRRDLRVEVLRKMHASWIGGSVDNGLRLKRKSGARSRGITDGSLGKEGTKRSKSLSPLFPRQRNREGGKMKEMKKNVDGSSATDETMTTNPAVGPEQPEQAKVTSGETAITTNESQPNNGGNSASGSETSAESDQQQNVVVRFRKAKGSNDAKSGSEGHSQDGSSENVCFSSVDRRNAKSLSVKSSPLLTSETTANSNQSLSTSTTASSTKTNSVSPMKSKQERKISSISNSGSVHYSNSGIVVATVVNSAQQTQSAPPVEKTRLQSAATQLKNFLAPNYKSRSEEFKKLFKPAENDKFVIDYSCAYQREILVHGRMYISQHLLCFYANIFTWETTIIVRLKDITNITKEKTAKVIPNALQVCTNAGDKLFFTSFSMRDKAYMMMFRIWQNALMDKLMHPAELYSLENHGYDEAEFSASDHEAEDALASLEEDSSGSGTKPNSAGDFPNLRNLAASASHLGSVPPLAGLPGADSVPASEEDTARSKIGMDANKNGGFMRSKPAKIARVSSGPSSCPTPTTPTEEYMESENDTEVNCPCVSHNGKEMLNCIYPISVDQLFLLLFTDSTFFRKLHEDRKTTELVLSDWSANQSNGTKSRQIAFVVSLNHSVGPKSCAVTEKQVCEASSKPGQLYVMTSEVSNSGIPYSDSFSVGVKYCLSRLSANKCRIRVHAGIIYKKSCWGIVKSFIEKNSLAGMEDFFADLDTHLHAECARFGLPDVTEERTLDKGGVLISKRHSIKKMEGETSMRSPSRRHTPSGEAGSLLPSEMENIAKGILLVLILMLLLNAALFYKLWYFEAEAERGSFENSLHELERILTRPDATPSDWLHVFHQVRFTQKKQLAEWLEELESAVQQLNHVQESLTKMRKQISTLQKDLGMSTIFRANLDDITWKEKEP